MVYQCVRFDLDLNAAKDDSNTEVQAKVKLAREKELLLTEHNELKEKFKVFMLMHSYHTHRVHSITATSCNPLLCMHVGTGRGKQTALSREGGP